MTARDSFGNVVAATSDVSGAVYFSFSVSGPVSSAGNLTAAGGGTYAVDLLLVQAGVYSLAIKLRDQSAIPGSPFSVVITPGETGHQTRIHALLAGNVFEPPVFPSLCFECFLFLSAMHHW